MKLLTTVLMILSTIAVGCGQAPVPEEKAEAVATPVPAVYATPAPVPQTTPIATAPTNVPNKLLWQDPITSTYWYVAGLGNVDKALNICYGDYRIPTYFELYRASIDGLAKFDPKITQIWSLDSAYFDPTDNAAKVYYVDLTDSTMKAGSGTDIKGLACIWDPEE